MHAISRHFGTRLVMLAAVSIVAASAAPAASNAAAPKSASATQSAKPAKLYCLEETITGSRIPRKDCRTIEQWKADGYEVKAKK